MAGEAFRKTYEFCAREGLKTGVMQERVDGGRWVVADHQKRCRGVLEGGNRPS